ncbi:TPA: Fe3+-citrate ABC transporter substrate-binding protein [Vibrio parahaemolyticus]|nr:Fe3+-citrate ABC transporter substrate-binding protein [Vibrio parahaemolyticus]HAV1982850.1 Fe3+-citrate ABC transporter substrate-binding protein [Vibrio parahaemolyticus]
METINAKAYFKSNTGYRFISKGKTAFKISIPKPDGSYTYRTVGFVRLGEEKALKKAIIERNKKGKEIWGKFWHQVVSDWTLLARLPRNLEPRHYLASDKESQAGEYRANWVMRKGDEVVKVARRYSCDEHGKLTAYLLAKKALMHAHKNNLELLAFMGRNSLIGLK